MPQLDGGVTVAEETLFQTRIDMPANLVEGDYARRVLPRPRPAR